MTKARTMICKCCQQTKPMKGWRAVMGVGRACADCVERINEASKAKQAALKAKAPKQREQKDAGPWTARKVEGKPTPAAQRDPRAVVCPSPQRDHRYQADPAEVTPMFSGMKPGQYQPGESWATRYIGEAA